jgi:hypothetical protein
VKTEPTRLDAGDAVELAELLGFVADWLTNEGPSLAPSLRRHAGAEDYDVDELRNDIRRFEFLLGGGHAFLGDNQP